MFDAVMPGKFVLSQTTMPSGMVTFVIKNKCVGQCSFDLEGIKAGRSSNPASSEHGPLGWPQGSTASTATSSRP